MEGLTGLRWDRMRRIAEERASALRLSFAQEGRADWIGSVTDLALGSFAAPGRVCDFDSEPCCGEPSACTGRSGQRYWQAHADHVAEMMAAMSEVFRGDRSEWHVTGLVHDADYVAHPHHVASIPAEAAHPFALLDALTSAGAPARVQLAVLEHAAHTGLRPSSTMSAALILADEHSTMTAFGMSPEYDGRLTVELAEALTPAPHRVEGYCRGDMEARALMAIERLLQP